MFLNSNNFGKISLPHIAHATYPNKMSDKTIVHGASFHSSVFEKWDHHIFINSTGV